MAKVLPGTAINKVEGPTKDLSPVEVPEELVVIVDVEVDAALATRLFSLAYKNVEEKDFLLAKIIGGKNQKVVAIMADFGGNIFAVGLLPNPEQPEEMLVYIRESLAAGEVLIIDPLGRPKFGTGFLINDKVRPVIEEKQVEAKTVFEAMQALEPIPLPVAEEKPADQPVVEAEVKPEEKPAK